MKKLSIYVLLILIYLGMTASFSPSQKEAPFMENELLFSNFFTGNPMSVILIDSEITGFIIKTYYQKYKIFHGFKRPEVKTIRTSKKFWERNLKNLGMSLYRSTGMQQKTDTIPMPPGILFVGNTSFGRWTTTDYGDRIWEFHKPYQHFPKEFGWQNYKFTQKAYNTMQIHLENNSPFYGTSNEFGTNGLISKEFLKLNYNVEIEEFNLLNHVINFFSFSRNKRAHPDE